MWTRLKEIKNESKNIKEEKKEKEDDEKHCKKNVNKFYFCLFVE